MSRHGEKIPRLGDEELRAMRESLLSDASRREAYAPKGTLSIIIDGKPCDSLEPNRQRRVRRAVGDETGWIEVHDRNSGGGLLLAAHHYCHDEAPPKGRKKYATTLEGGQRITFVAYKKDGQPYVEISYGETRFSKALALQGRRLKNELNRLVHLFLDRTRLVVTPRGALPARRAAYSLALLCLCGTLAILIPYLIPYLRRGGAPDATPQHVASNSPVHNPSDISVASPTTTDQPISTAPAQATPTPPAIEGRSNSPAKKSNPKKSYPKSTPQLAGRKNTPSTHSPSLSSYGEIPIRVRLARVTTTVLRRSGNTKDDRGVMTEVGLAERSRSPKVVYKYHKLPYGTQGFEQGRGYR
jgi:hypothetical protein